MDVLATSAGLSSPLSSLSRRRRAEGSEREYSRSVSESELRVPPRLPMAVCNISALNWSRGDGEEDLLGRTSHGTSE
jgi:hypothetical protein